MEKIVKIRATLFGKFQLSDGVQVLDEETIRSEMVTKLLVYLLIHRNEELTIPEITEALWWNGEVDNPTGALKNLMYRLRSTLKKKFGDGQEYILTKRGSYGWNPEIPVELDSEQFEKYCTRAKDTEEISEKRSLFERAVELYQGSFMRKLYAEHFIIPLAAYYHSLYLSTVKQLAQLYMEGQEYEEMEQLCSRALNYDRLDEHLNALHIRALMGQNKQKIAMDQYRQAVKNIYEELGVREPEELKKVYTELMSMHNESVEAPIEDIQDDMNEESGADGAFLCGYPVFREIYRLEARRMKRMGVSEYILLLTLGLKSRLSAGAEAESYMKKQAMSRMEQTICRSLRIGDVVARYSDTQFVAMLPTCNYETSRMIAERILSSFTKDKRNYNIQVEYDVEEISETDSVYMRKG